MENEELNEQAEVQEEQAPEVTTEEPSDYSDALAVEKSEDEAQPETEEVAPEDQEVELEIGGKVFKGKMNELVERLEQWEKLTEKEKNLNRDYTQKTQQLAEQRKSLENAFGGQMPNEADMANLGKIYNAYFSNPEAQAAINAILSGQPLSHIFGGQVEDPNAPQPSQETRALLSEINALRQSQAELQQSITQRDHARLTQEAKNIWEKWVSQQESEITEDVNNRMAPFINSISVANPDWDDLKVLDEAYRHATIDDIERATTKKVLKKADQAKRSVPRITPKSPQKSEQDMSYADLMMNQ